MRQAVREWLTETHGARFELLRHFLPRFFDSDLVGKSGDWMRVAIGALAILASSWILLFATLLFKYNYLAQLNLRARFQAEMAADALSLTCMAVSLTVLLVAALWQSFYPTLRDCLALAARPVSFADIFVAKFSAVAIAFGAFVMLLVAPAAMVFSAVTGAGIVGTFATMAAACTLSFFGPIVLQGALLNVLPARMFERVMVWLQALFAAIAIGGFPLAAGQGPKIIGNLGFSSRDLFLGALLAPVLAVLIYLISFHRYRRLLLEAPRARPPQHHDLLSRLLDRWITDPREQAAFTFVCKTIQRSRIHRLAVTVFAALAAAFLAESAIDLLTGSVRRSDLGSLVLTGFVLTLTLFTLAGLRHLFSLPADLRANWMFQITERQARRAWLNAIERFALVCVIVPLVIASAILARTDGLFMAIAWPMLAFFLAAISFEHLFRDWRKLPFACSYLPGKGPLILTLVRYLGLLAMLVPLSVIVYRSSTNPFAFLVVLALELVVWSYLRRARKSRWGLLPLRFEDQPDSEIDVFSLSGEGTTIAQEQFQQEWSDYLRGGPDVPIVRALEAGETRTKRAREWLRDVPADLRYAMRLLAKKPGFAITAVLTLSLGLGLNATFFTIFNAFLLKPLVVRDPGSLVSVDFETRTRAAVSLGVHDLESIAKDAGAFSEVWVTTLDATGLDGQSARVALVSGNYFSMLGAGAELGLPFQAGERGAVMVLSYPVWQARFGGDPKIIGRKLLVNGFPFEVIAVTVPQFAGVPVGTVEIVPQKFARFGQGAPDFWVPIEAWNRLPGVTAARARGVIGRLRPGTSAEQAQAMVLAYAQRLTTTRVHWEQIARVEMESLEVPVTWTALTYSLPLLMAFGLTMLIPCANAANLILARAMARQREFGVRLSLGAGRGRLIRQLLTESLILAAIAAGSGLVLSRIALYLVMRIFHSTAPTSLLFRVRLPDMSIDGHIFFYMLIVTVLTTVLFALAPAAQATRAAVALALREEFGAFRVSRLRDALVVGQVSACVMLLVMAGVLLRGSKKMTQIDRGYSAVNVYGVANQNVEDARALLAILSYESWIDTQAILGNPLNSMGSIQVRDRAASGSSTVYYNHGSSEFFHLLRISILRGRTFTPDEAENRAAVTVVSQLAARQLWPGEDAIGKTIAIDPGQQDNFRLPRFREAIVIGVSSDIVSKAKDGGPRAAVYFPDALRIGDVVVVRGKGPPEQTRRQLAAALARAPGAAHGARVVALQETIEWETYPQQAASWLSSLLSVFALLLSISGMYGVMSYLVSQRTREIGIRMALGATPGQVAQFVLRYSVRLVGAGLVVGMFLALGGLQYTASKIELMIDLYDFTAYSLGLAVVVVAALFATLGPTHRACRVDPQVALRAD